MDWIKRNLLFVVGSVVSLVLMVLASVYLMSGMRKNEEALGKLNSEYEQLKRLNSQNPHPGDDKIDNIAAAKNQKQETDAVIRKASGVFAPIDPVPAGTNLNSAMFAGALRRTIDRLHHEAIRGGVQVPTNFYFSFTAVQNRIMFDQAGLQPLAAQLGEVKAICDVLLGARINALDAVRRQKVSTHDTEAQQMTDYITDAAVTNEIAVLAPYEVTFRCFSAELANVLSGYASSPHGLVVRAMNVEPVTAGANAGYGNAEGGMASPSYETATPAYTAAAPFPVPGAAAGVNRYAGAEDQGGNPYLSGNRYAGAGTQGMAGNRPANPYEANQAGGAPATYPTYPAVASPTVRPRTGAGRGGLPTMLDEKQFRVTMLVQAVRLNLKTAE